MTIYDLRATVSLDTVLWIETAEGAYCEAGESAHLSHKYDDRAIKSMYPEHYKSLYCTGITAQI